MMESLVVTLDTAKKLKASGFPQYTHDYWNRWTGKRNKNVVYSLYGSDIQDPITGRRVTGRTHDLDWNIAAAPTAQEIADQLPAVIKSQLYSGREAELRMGKGDTGGYFAWYYVIDIENVASDYGAHAATMAEALAALWLKLNGEGK
jgi:hypothetical protein